MNIVILGGTGYLGSRILRMLADNGHRLLCICRKPQEHMGDEQIEYCDLSGMSQRLQNFVPDIYKCNWKIFKGRINGKRSAGSQF